MTRTRQLPRADDEPYDPPSSAGTFRCETNGRLLRLSTAGSFRLTRLLEAELFPARRRYRFDGNDHDRGGAWRDDGAHVGRVPDDTRRDRFYGVRRHLLRPEFHRQLSRARYR